MSRSLYRIHPRDAANRQTREFIAWNNTPHVGGRWRRNPETPTTINYRHFRQKKESLKNYLVIWKNKHTSFVKGGPRIFVTRLRTFVCIRTPPSLVFLSFNTLTNIPKSIKFHLGRDVIYIRILSYTKIKFCFKRNNASNFFPSFFENSARCTKD